MKKLILLALLAVIMAGCEQDNKPNYPRYIKKKGTVCVEIDGCEYIVNKERYAFAYTDGRYETYTHKGNCKFCAQRDSIKWEKRKAEIVELLKIKDYEDSI